MIRYLLVIILFFSSWNAKGQDDPLVIEIGEHDKLGDILQRLENRDWQFAYAPDHLLLKPVQTGRIQSNSVEELFIQLFGDELEIHRINGHQILLRGHNQPDQEVVSWTIIKGQVICDGIGPVEDILIYDDRNRNETISKSDGSFELRVDPETQFVYFQGLGYKMQAVSISALTTNKTVVLQANPFDIAPVIVISKLPALTMQDLSYKINQDHLHIGGQALSISGNDVVRSFQLLPGVQAHDDLDASIKIRGSENASTLMLLDGIPIYKADHFYGIFSSINGDYIKEANLYKNALPVEYGGKTGGLLEMRSPFEIPAEPEGAFEINRLSSALMIHWPISRNSSILLAGRSSYLKKNQLGVFDYLENMVENYAEELSNLTRKEIFSSQPNFNYADFNGKLLLKPSEKTALDLNFYLSRDRFENGYNINYRSRNILLESTNNELFNSHESWDNQGASLNIDHKLGSNWVLKGNTYFTVHENSGGVESALDRRLGNQVLSASFTNVQENMVEDIGAHMSLNYTVKDAEVKIGSSVKYQKTLFKLTEDENDLVRRNQNAIEYSLFGSYQYQFEKLRFSIGARSNYFTSTEDVYLDPQINLLFQYSNAWRWKASFSLMHQYVREISYENRLGQTTDYFIIADGQYPVSTSHNLMIGWNYQQSAWTFDVEFYHRKIDGVLEFARPQLGFLGSIGPPRDRQYQIFSGEGRVNGVDILLQYDHRNYLGWIGYTLSKSTRSFRSIRRGIDFPSEDDRRHQLSWVNSYTTGRFQFSANYIFASGRPYLDVTQIGNNERESLDPEQWINRLPSYNRLDVGVTYQCKVATYSAKLGISLFNLFNTNNVKYLQYIYSIPTQGRNDRTINTIVGTETGLLKRTLNISLRLDF